MSECKLLDIIRASSGIKLGSKTYTVEFNPVVVNNNIECYGTCDFGTLVLQQFVLAPHLGSFNKKKPCSMS